jgi:hypothetical protein
MDRPTEIAPPALAGWLVTSIETGHRTSPHAMAGLPLARPAWC